MQSVGLLPELPERVDLYFGGGSPTPAWPPGLGLSLLYFLWLKKPGRRVHERRVCTETEQLGQSCNYASGLGVLLCAHQGSDSVLCPAPSLHRGVVQAQRGDATPRVTQPGSTTIPTPLCSRHCLLPRCLDRRAQTGFSSAVDGGGSQFLASLPIVECQEHPLLASGQSPSSKP